MTLNNLMNHIWLRFIKTLNKLTLHFQRKDGLCRLRHSEDGLNLCPPPSKVSRHLRVIICPNIISLPFHIVDNVLLGLLMQVVESVFYNFCYLLPVQIV